MAGHGGKIVSLWPRRSAGSVHPPAFDGVYGGVKLHVPLAQLLAPDTPPASIPDGA